MNNSICTLFDNILIDIHKFKSLHYEKRAILTFCFENTLPHIIFVEMATLKRVR